MFTPQKTTSESRRCHLVSQKDINIQSKSPHPRTFKSRATNLEDNLMILGFEKGESKTEKVAGEQPIDEQLHHQKQALAALQAKDDAKHLSQIISMFEKSTSKTMVASNHFKD